MFCVYVYTRPSLICQDKKKKKKNLPQVTSMPELLQTLHFTISSTLLQN